MSESLPESADTRGERPGDAVPDAADQRMADMLRDRTVASDGLRAELQGEGSQEASDLLNRLDALDFVQQVVGSPSDVPTRIGGYDVKGVLGRGGMGTVYLGWQQELEREVALKVLAPSYASDVTMRKRFRAEARATAALHHRHIVPIYDYGEAGGVLFFAMERVDGMSLDKHIAAARHADTKPMEPLDCARRFAGVADALGLAHRRRLLHRDVKPGNILVGKDGTLALTDFGLAKALDHASMKLTAQGGGFLGTLHYSSPEQALGDELTPASDLYALGVTMFEALTGELPRAGKTTESLLQSIMHGEPRRLRDFVPKPPRDLEAVLDKLLSREPRDRYQDGEELARDLQRIADGEPVHIRRLPLHVRLWRRARKNPVLSGAIAAAVVLLLVSVVLLTVLRREHGRGLVSRHQQHLVAIAQSIGSESGAPWGPEPLLTALTGQEVEAVSPSESILKELDRAERELPDDPQVAAMRSAYVDDPAPAASALLREGRGHEALRWLDAAIVDAVAARTAGTLDVELRLHRLYLGRGVANLTASLARATDARTDLVLANYLRPGAVFPRALLDVLDVVQASDVGPAVARLERELQASARERVQVVGQLLWCAAALQPLPQANLMDFELSFPKRRALHDAALRLLGQAPVDAVPADQPTGLAATFAGLCLEALGRTGDPTALRDLAQRAEAGIDAAVHPGSPLQGWRAVVQMLRDPTRKGPLVDRDQQPLSPAMQRAAWDDFVRLQPAREKMLLWLPRFEEFRRNHPGLSGLARTAAQLHLLAGSGEALAHANAWVIEADGDPRAQLCRMQCQLRLGALAEARDDAIVAVQSSIMPQAALADVVRLCQDCAPWLQGADLEGLRILTQQFRGLLDRGIAPHGGR